MAEQNDCQPRLREVCRDGAELHVTWSGSLQEEPTPTVDNRVEGTIGADAEDDLSRCPAFAMAYIVWDRALNYLLTHSLSHSIELML